METLTDKQKELLLSNKEDLKAIVMALWKTQPLSFNSTDEEDFDSFASQFERKPRFVTNGDGEEIFDGDYFYWVESIDWSIQSAICTDDMQGKQIERTYFKSKEKAEKYITLNAPRLSVNDVMEVVGQYVFAPSFYKDKLVELVKSKQ